MSPPIFYRGQEMCKYVDEEAQCKIQNSRCPFMYYCTKVNQWLAMDSMPPHCKVAITYELPADGYLVKQCKRGLLYIDANGTTITIPNPFHETPVYVVMTRKGDEWVLQEGGDCSGRLGKN